MGQVIGGALGSFGQAGGGGAGQVLGIFSNAIGEFADFRAQQQAAAAEAQRQAIFVQQRNEALKLQQESLRLQQSQAHESGARERFQEGRRLRRAQAEAQTAGSAGGVGGASLNELLRDFSTQTAGFTEASLRQQQFGDLQTGLRIRTADQQASFDISSNTAPIEKPSFAASILRIGTTVSKAFPPKR